MPPKIVTIINSKLPEGGNTAEVHEDAAEVFIAQNNGWKLAPKSQQPDTPKS